MYRAIIHILPLKMYVFWLVGVYMWMNVYTRVTF